MKAFDLNLRGLAAPVLVVGLDDPEQLFSDYFSNWPYDISPRGEEQPFATLVFNGDRYLLKTNKSDEPIPHATPVNAICDLVAAAARQRADERPEEMCLHAASVRMGAALVVFPAVRRAGKSSLTMALAAKGYKVFGDDVLSVASTPREPVIGKATGSSIRLRLPLPQGLPSWVIEHIETYRGPGNRQYLYVSPPEIATNGQQAPIGALVHLERCEDVATKLSPMSPGLMLKSILKQNFARSFDADHILGDLFELAENTPAFLLQYSDIEEVVDLLVSYFHDQKVPTARVKDRTAQGSAEIKDIPAGVEIMLRQNPTAVLRELGGEIFATNSDLTRVLHLNDGAVRIWKLLAEPTSEAEAVEIFQTAFPNVPFGELESDTRKIFRDFRRSGLVVMADPRNG